MSWLSVDREGSFSPFFFGRGLGKGVGRDEAGCCESGARRWICQCEWKIDENAFGDRGWSETDVF